MTQSQAEAGAGASAALTTTAFAVCAVLLVVATFQVWAPPLRRRVIWWLHDRRMRRADYERARRRHALDGHR